MEEELLKILASAVPIGIAFIIGVAIVAYIREWVHTRWFIKNGDRRKKDNGWPNEMIVLLTRMDTNISAIHEMMNNGFSSNMEEITREIKICHELNAEKFRDLRESFRQVKTD